MWTKTVQNDVLSPEDHLSRHPSFPPSLYYLTCTCTEPKTHVPGWLRLPPFPSLFLVLFEYTVQTPVCLIDLYKSVRKVENKKSIRGNLFITHS